MELHHLYWYSLPDPRLCIPGRKGGQKWISYSFTPTFFSR